MKKITCILAALALMAVMTGCGSETSSDKSSVTEKPAVSETEAVSETAKAVREETPADSDEEKTETEAAAGEAAANQYGFFAFTNPPASGVSVSALAGVWKNADAEAGPVLTVASQYPDIYSGTWILTAADGSIRSGYINFEYKPEGEEKKYWFNFYESSGALWESFQIPGEMQFADIYTAERKSHYIRTEDRSVTEAQTEAVTGTPDITETPEGEQTENSETVTEENR